MSGAGQTGRTIVLHPQIVDAIELYGGQLLVQPKPGISVIFSAVLRIPGGQTFEGQAARAADAIQALEEAVLADHNRELEGAR